MAAPDSRESYHSVFIMVLVALLFGYFGFVVRWIETDALGNPVWIVTVFKWTLQATAVGSGIAAIVAFVNRLASSIIFSVVGLLSAIMFFVVIGWHYLTDAPAPIHPLLLLILALWNGYSSSVEVRALLREYALRRQPSRERHVRMGDR